MVIRNIGYHKRLVEEEIYFSGLEFINSDNDGLEWCYPFTHNDSLARLAEVYEVPTSPSLKGITINPRSAEAESKEGEESLPRVAVHGFIFYPAMNTYPGYQQRFTNQEYRGYPGQNPSCPCHGIQIVQMLGLI